ncbi:alpha/beta fold hydrolase [Dyadobacter sp. CY312]|uniref:alpha/beta fold hydrolase n=1 Tax=Dyadobacter sp. CY312 TaxID=2907303 RepID=UPI001F1CA797|nr:alpha/beta hydrolase [Dyadobacter sp. CY312]MCE7044097.1 alpha/beta hydrolase [Dyadobacter sp. CY312]
MKSQAKKYLSILLLSVLIPTISANAQSVKFPEGWTDGYAYVSGIRSHYYHAKPAPGKPVMVMVHGYTDIGLSWTTLTLKLQDAYDIYMIDARGHGLTDPPTASDNGETMIKDVVDFVKFMKFDKPILIGHSMGAATVMRVGAQYPDLAKAIIMLDPFVGNRPTRPAPSSAAPVRRPNMFKSPDTLVAQNNTPFEQVVATGKRQNPLWSDLDIYYWAVSKKQYHGPYSPEQAQAMTGTMSTADALAKIKVPALILKADGKPEVRKANEEAARVMQNGKLIHIDGAGHNLHHDKLTKTVEVLNAFLQGI